jgi:ELWxxDGT repeat protein
MKNLSTITLLTFWLTINLINGQSFVKDFYSISQLTEVNNQTFFVASDGTYGAELWKTDGTKEGTVMVKDINPISNSGITNLTSFNNELYFSATDGFFGQELWKTDGTEEGTVMVKNIHEAFGASSIPSNFTIFNNELYFTATDNYANGSFQIWKTNGTEEGTIKIYDADGISISQLISANNKLYFKLNYGPNRLMEFDLNLGVNEVLTDEYYSIAELNTFNNELYFITHTSNRASIRFYRLSNLGNPIF